MIDGIEHEDDDFGEEDPRTPLWESIANAIATLSDATDTPTGVRAASSSIQSDDVDMTSDAWMQQFAQVQDWLNLGLPQGLTDDGRDAFLAKLVSGLELDSAEALDTSVSPSQFTPLALERLSQRIELAVRLQKAFAEERESDGVTRSSATSNWASAWEESEPVSDQLSTEPVTATADVISINELTTSDLNLTPSYQRGDVWTTNDRQALIESVLRGIPLPSIILREVGPSDPQEVVDGKQRLTALLRFVGSHPAALARVQAADSRHPGQDLLKNFKEDYLKFKTAWKSLERESLTVEKENDYFFPFKLRNNDSGGLKGPALEALQGKYYTQILKNVIKVAGAEMTVEKLFTKTTAYKVPVIRYTQADPRQIHDVFKLYNKQGVHLNAEEIRNAAFHEIELTAAILVAAGDADPRVDAADIAPSLAKVPKLTTIGASFEGYGIGRARYRRTKILSWILSVLLLDTKVQKVKSTARHIDEFLTRVQDDKQDPLRSRKNLTDLFKWLTEAFDLHARHPEIWSEKFMDGGKGAKWQELQLVGSMVGVAFALAASPNDVEKRIDQNANEILIATSSDAWGRIENAQTKTQWDYIARIAKGVLTLLKLDPSEASKAVRDRFGSSGYESLMGTILSEEGR
ncbi:DUF262 domain-containing protein [Acidovorax sp. CCYZU-2555]|uniref:GmrSD restriction endonuclease domain-containing protein n=1 Tax=Acidovorax sp. CCYZU-2555 TaxID=2835042 RepID=UPI001BCF3559|nr:DUF262 domain-containing protein [Acidovorax sp. CCYZU-2555]MBS7776706.1 DUF262 domain-containing protein [Acidovorax sp. CCYZU-2555]